MVYPAKGRLPEAVADVYKSQLIKAIDEANLGLSDSRIAYMYLIDRIPQMDIAEDLGVNRKTVSRRLKSITPKVTAATKLPQ